MSRMRAAEYYPRWALENLPPCETCPPKYREAYAKLEGAVEAADSAFRRAYDLYAELRNLYNGMRREQMRRKE